MTPHLNYGCSGDLWEVVHVPLPLGAGALYEPLGTWKWHLLIGNEEKRDTHVWVLQLHWLQAFYFVFIIVGKVQHLEKISLNLRLELHMPPCPLLLTARKMPFFPWKDIRGMVTSATSTIPTLCILPLDNHSTLAPSSLERTIPVWYGASSQGNGNCSAPLLGLLSRSIWICFSVSPKLGTF